MGRRPERRPTRRRRRKWYRAEDAEELIATAEWRGALVYLDAARAGDSATGDAHLAEAKAIAAHIPLGAEHYRLAFDPDSVRIWGVGLAVERRDGIEAVKRAALLPRSRRARRANGSVTTGLILLEDPSCTATAPGHCGRFRSPEAPRRCRPATISAGSRNDHHAVEHERRRSESLATFARWAGVTGS